MKKVIVLLGIFLAFFVTTVKSETLILKSGREIKGKITKRASDYIEFESSGKNYTYFLDEIKEIVGEGGFSSGSSVPAITKTDEASSSSNQKVELLKQFENMFSSKDYPAALKILNELLVIDPKNADLYIGGGAIYFHLEQFEKSASYFEKAIELGSKSGIGYLLLAVSYQNSGRYQEAANSYTLAIEQFNQEDNTLSLFLAEEMLNKMKSS